MGRSSASAFTRLVRVARTGSTSSDLLEALAEPGAAADWPHLSVLVADHQDAGRGRSGRVWETPAGAALTASVALRLGVPAPFLPWAGLLAGLALVRAVGRRTALDVALKWPNDVLVRAAGGGDVPGWGRDRKVAGVLTERAGAVAPAQAVLVVGIGVNLHQERLPVPWATSLAAAGVPAAARDGGALLEAFGAELSAVLDRWQRADGDARGCGLAAEVESVCATLGHPVVVALPGGREVRGTAEALAEDGALVVRSDEGALVAVRAGDVGHVRGISG